MFRSNGDIMDNFNGGEGARQRNRHGSNTKFEDYWKKEKRDYQLVDVELAIKSGPMPFRITLLKHVCQRAFMAGSGVDINGN